MISLQVIFLQKKTIWILSKSNKNTISSDQPSLSELPFSASIYIHVTIPICAKGTFCLPYLTVQTALIPPNHKAGNPTFKINDPDDRIKQPPKAESLPPTLAAIVLRPSKQTTSQHPTHTPNHTNQPPTMPTAESAAFLAKKPTVAPTYEGVDFEDNVAVHNARDAIIREQWVRSMMARLVGEELGKCYAREGVNHLEKCGVYRGGLFFSFFSPVYAAYPGK